MITETQIQKLLNKPNRIKCPIGGGANISRKMCLKRQNLRYRYGHIPVNKNAPRDRDSTKFGTTPLLKFDDYCEKCEIGKKVNNGLTPN